MKFTLALVNSEYLKNGIIPSAMCSEVIEIILGTHLSDEKEVVRTNLSQAFRDAFPEFGWELDTNLLLEPAKTVTLHFYKNKIGVQVSWRHYEKIGSEMLKFQTDYVDGKIKGAVFVCVTEEFRNEISDAFQGSITMEKALTYLESVSAVIKVPILLIGLVPQS